MGRHAPGPDLELALVRLGAATRDDIWAGGDGDGGSIRSTTRSGRWERRGEAAPCRVGGSWAGFWFHQYKMVWTRKEATTRKPIDTGAVTGASTGLPVKRRSRRGWNDRRTLQPLLQKREVPLRSLVMLRHGAHSARRRCLLSLTTPVAGRRRSAFVDRRASHCVQVLSKGVFNCPSISNHQSLCEKSSNVTF